MYKKYADKWVKALRSGKYNQGRGKLNDGDENFCCLGVLCEIVKDTFDIKVEEAFDNGRRYVYNKENTRDGIYLLPVGLSDKLGLCCADPQFLDGVILSVLNDKDKYTFEQIADLIEKKYKEL
jgi:hypothetical protein